MFLFSINKKLSFNNLSIFITFSFIDKSTFVSSLEESDPFSLDAPTNSDVKFDKAEKLLDLFTILPPETDEDEVCPLFGILFPPSDDPLPRFRNLDFFIFLDLLATTGATFDPIFAALVASAPPLSSIAGSAISLY